MSAVPLVTVEVCVDGIGKALQNSNNNNNNNSLLLSLFLRAVVARQASPSVFPVYAVPRGGICGHEIDKKDKQCT